MENLETKAEKLYQILHTLGKKWSLELLTIAKKAPRTYTELQKELGINSKLVSSKIKELIELDILKKIGDKYDLSKFGKKLYKKIKPLAKAVSEFANDVEKKIEKEAKDISKKLQEATSKKEKSKEVPLKTEKISPKKATPTKKVEKQIAKKTATLPKKIEDKKKAKTPSKK